jgi:hypothetical protein
VVVHRPDRSPPDTWIKNPPAGPVGTPFCLFEFAGSDLESPASALRYSWRLDGGAWSPWSPETLATVTDLANGRHTFEVRTDFRKPTEDVYIYRTRMPPENARKFFMEYIRQINSMKENPEWYNTLTTNCTTDVVRLIRDYGGKATYNWKVLLSGYTPLYAYEMGGLDTRIPFEELRKLSYVNPKAVTLGDDPEFSRKIREGLPRP